MPIIDWGKKVKRRHLWIIALAALLLNAQLGYVAADEHRIKNSSEEELEEEEEETRAIAKTKEPRRPLIESWYASSTPVAPNKPRGTDGKERELTLREAYDLGKLMEARDAGKNNITFVQTYEQIEENRKRLAEENKRKAEEEHTRKIYELWTNLLILLVATVFIFSLIFYFFKKSPTKKQEPPRTALNKGFIAASQSLPPEPSVSMPFKQAVSWALTAASPFLLFALFLTAQGKSNEQIFDNVLYLILIFGVLGFFVNKFYVEHFIGKFDKKHISSISIKAAAALLSALVGWAAYVLTGPHSYDECIQGMKEAKTEYAAKKIENSCVGEYGRR